MPVEVRVPQMGESIVEATVGKWLKKEGDPVNAGEPVAELETEKVNLEVSAPQPGVIERIAKGAGETVRVGDVLCSIREGAAVPALPTARPAAVTAPPAQTWAPAPPQPAEETPDGQGVLATPLARRIAAERGIDLSLIKGSGIGGRITEKDIETAVATRPQGAPETPASVRPAPAPVEAQPVAPRGEQSEARAGVQSEARAGDRAGVRTEERVRLTRRQLTMARRLVEAQQTAVMTTTFNEIDMGAVVELRKARRAQFRERHGVDLGYMSFFVKACVGALRRHPRINADLQGDELVIKHYYDIGVAIGVGEGLVVPVLRDADRRSFAEIEAAIADMGVRARDRKLTMEELQGGTFSITNGGIFGSLLSTPVLNPPQLAILGMHVIRERPVVANGQVVVRPMMYAAVTYDHRVIEGREAVEFLVKIKEQIEDPARIMLEM